MLYCVVLYFNVHYTMELKAAVCCVICYLFGLVAALSIISTFKGAYQS